ncbi:MAG: NUDIX domain-containing protein [Bacilli bacterium]|nr:NUDIX domain-containing protein [Bacilli bacterium]
MKKEISCGTITFYNNKVLLIKQNRGYVGFPKGHMEEGETEEETAIRETKEETNIDVKVYKEHKYYINYVINNHINKDVIFFLAEPLSFDIQKQDSEIEKSMWVDKDLVCEYLSYDDTKEVFLEALNDIESLTSK